MSDILKGLTSGLRTFLLAWVFPSAIALGIFSLWIFPRIEHLPALRDVADLTSTQKTLVLAFSAVAVGVILNAADTRLYRLLEGYSWPSWAQNWGVNRQIARRTRCAEEFDKAPVGWRKALAYEQLQRFPASDDQITPTRLGNALRAFETYGADRFKLDSQFFWFEIFGLAPEHLRSEYEDARATVDFFIASIYLSVLLGVVALIAAIALPDAVLVWIALPSFIVAPIAYRYSLDGISNWGAAIQAIVNVGREELASKLSLVMPPTIEEERTMWERVHAFLYYPYEDDLARQVDRFRAPTRGR